MDIQEIEVTITEQGEVLIHVRGVKGDKCLVITKDIEQILGNEVLLREMTSEFYENIAPDQKNVNNLIL
jgi:hypothetical protein